MSQDRLARLAASLRTTGLDAVALNPGPSLAYLTGLHFHLMERPVVLLVSADHDPVIVLPQLELPKVELFPYEVQAIPYGEDPAGWERAFREAAQVLHLEAKRIGVEPRQMRLLEYHHLRAGAPEADYADASEVLAGLRVRKDAAEVEALRRAVQIAQDALEAALPLARIGITEREFASELVIQLFKHGSDAELPFAPIVSAGPNSANPHASPTDRKLGAGDLLVVDWGAAYRGYISDLTRTFAVGDVDDEFRRIHRIVQQANEAGRAAARPGVTASEVDRAARGVIEGAGYGRFFTHRTGHGIGMEAHEDPFIRDDNMTALEAGMVFTVEPGIYLKDRNGVRIEDNVVVTANGAEGLSDMPREIRVVG